MGNWIFSAIMNWFYPLSMKDLYVDAGSWPPDAVDISDEDHTTYSGTPPAGKKLGNISGYPAWVDIIYDPDEVYFGAITQIVSNAMNAATGIKVPYPFEESSSWQVQVSEARAWTNDSNYVPVMLNAMVTASGGAWVLSDLAATIILNDDAWRNGVGNILGQVKSKRAALEVLKSEVDAGTADVHLIVNYDCTIITPAISLTDKYA